jgi:L-fuculose-phosphate aldolase
MPYDQMTPADVVTVTCDGRQISPGRPSRELRVHLAIYAARPEVGGVVHTHSVYATAWSFSGLELAPDTEDLRGHLGGPVRVVMPAVAGSEVLADAVVEALDGRYAALLGRHGVIALGATANDALEAARTVEQQALIATVSTVMRHLVNPWDDAAAAVGSVDSRLG